MTEIISQESSEEVGPRLDRKDAIAASLCCLVVFGMFVGQTAIRYVWHEYVTSRPDPTAEQVDPAYDFSPYELNDPVHILSAPSLVLPSE